MGLISFLIDLRILALCFVLFFSEIIEFPQQVLVFRIFQSSKSETYLEGLEQVHFL